MYMLRLISAVLHLSPGPSISEAALDLRPAELGILVPLVACLLVLSAWPSAITDRSFGRAPQAAVFYQFAENAPATKIRIEVSKGIGQ